LERGDSSAVGRDRVGYNRPDYDQQHCYHYAPTVKPEAAIAVVELLMMGVRTPETCSAVNKLQAINLRNRCIWLVDLFELLTTNVNEVIKVSARLWTIHTKKAVT
jgi:hypothetical protein